MAGAVKEIHWWARELLGARVYMRAMNNPAQKRRIVEINEEIEAGRIDPADVRATLTGAGSHGRELEALLDEIETIAARKRRRRPLAGTSSRRTCAERAESAAKSTPSSPASEQSDSLARAEIARLRRHAVELEVLVRALAERAVYDATRIRGLETSLMMLARKFNSAADVEGVYVAATGEFLAARNLKVG